MQRTLEITIDAPAEKVWDILARRYCEIAGWTRAVQRSWPMRQEQIPPEVQVAPAAPFPGRMVVTPLGQLGEVLTEYSEPERSFTFLALGVPGIVTRSTDRTTVHALGPSRCRVTLEIELLLWGGFRILEPLLKRRIARALQPMLEDLKHFAETDTLAPGVAPARQEVA